MQDVALTDSWIYPRNKKEKHGWYDTTANIVQKLIMYKSSYQPMKYTVHSIWYTIGFIVLYIAVIM